MHRGSAYNVGNDGMLTSRSRARSVKAQTQRQVRCVAAVLLLGSFLTPGDCVLLNTESEPGHPTPAVHRKAGPRCCDIIVVLARGLTLLWAVWYQAELRKQAQTKIREKILTDRRKADAQFEIMYRDLVVCPCDRDRDVALCSHVPTWG